MMINLFRNIFSALLLISTVLPATDQETEKIMPFVSDNQECMKCHNTERMKKKITVSARACDRFCITCHRNTADKHHKTGIMIRDRENLKLPLSASGRIACFTCHDLTIKRYDTGPWKAQSLFDRTFRSKDRYRTYYLTGKNTDGELCKKCH